MAWSMESYLIKHRVMLSYLILARSEVIVDILLMIVGSVALLLGKEQRAIYQSLRRHVLENSNQFFHYHL